MKLIELNQWANYPVLAPFLVSVNWTKHTDGIKNQVPNFWIHLTISILEIYTKW